MNLSEEIKHIGMVNEVKKLFEQTPEGQIVDSDTILKDLMDNSSFEETGLSTEILDIYLKAKDRESIEKLFYTFTGMEFERYLEKCISETTRPIESIVAFDIVWDTDEEDVSLPSLVVVPKEQIPERIFDMNYDSLSDEDMLVVSDNVSDWLSEKYEFCHDGFCIDYSGNTLREYLENKFATASDEYDDETSFYMDLIEAGITVEHVRDIMNNSTAVTMQMFCEEHGLLQVNDTKGEGEYE